MKTLPIHIHYHSAGVKGSNLAEAVNGARQNRLSLDVNAHGNPNGKPPEFYANLQNTTLKEYLNIGLDSRETSYFLGMYLRIIRAIDFATAQPEWDGKNVVVFGNSQGGAQAILAAGLDQRVTEVNAGCPAFCNLMGSSLGQMAGFPFSARKLTPKELTTVSYFDAIYHVTRAKAKATFRIGLVDETCWSWCMFAAYNRYAGEKTLNTPPTTHFWNALPVAR